MCEKDKVASWKVFVLHSKVMMIGIARDYQVFNTTSLICCLTLQLFHTDEAFKMSGRKHTHIHTLEIFKYLLRNVQNTYK